MEIAELIKSEVVLTVRCQWSPAVPWHQFCANGCKVHLRNCALMQVCHYDLCCAFLGITLYDFAL